MPTIRPTVAELTTRAAKLIRDEVTVAAGADGVLQDPERDLLTPFVQAAAAGLTGKSAVVDAAMTKATATWASFNQASGPGKAWLSQAELARLDAADPALGTLTRGALAIAAKIKDTRPPLSVALVDAPAGVAMGTSGARVLDVSLSAGPTVPVGARFGIVVDGHRLDVVRTAGGLDVWNLRAPDGYGLEVVDRGQLTDPTSTARLKITRDAETALPHSLVVERAKAGLVSFLKNDRIDDADWAQYFPTTWAGNVARGVLGDVDKFFSTADVQRKKDSVLFTGAGPYGLYTEIEVSKKDGKVKASLVEID